MKPRSFSKLCLSLLVAAVTPFSAQHPLADAEPYSIIGPLSDFLPSDVAGGGDVNNDGVDDIVIGSPQSSPNGAGSGQVLVYSGANSELLYTWNGETAGDKFGSSVAIAGDIDSDGFMDVIVGAPESDAAGPFAGRVIVYSGRTGASLSVLDGESDYDQFGSSVAGVGDLNQDGIPDFIVGAKGYNPPGSSENDRRGRVYVFSGLNGETLNLLTGPAPETRLGTFVASAGDVDNDGVNDIAAGTEIFHKPGEAYIYSGADGSVLYTIHGSIAGDRFGSRVGGIGDVNNDNHADIYIYTPGSTGVTPPNRGAVYSGIDGTLIYSLAEVRSSVITGSPIAAVGDWNNDGYDDLLVGQAGDSGSIPGVARVLSGNTGDELCVFAPEGRSRMFGSAVGSAGDMNGDGTLDAIICDPARRTTYIYLGTSTAAISVALDIKPGSCPNSLNVNGKSKTAVIPAAILGSSEFDVHDIDVSSLTLAGAQPVRHSYEDVATPAADASDCACNEDGPDGFQDLTLKFNRSELLSALNSGAGASLTLNGALMDGTEIEGSDCVIFRPRGAAESTALGAGGTEGETALLGNFPNPFNPTTKISFSIANTSHAKIEIFDVLGRRTATILNGTLPAGTHTVMWDASQEASGIYFYRLTTEETVLQRKMILLK